MNDVKFVVWEVEGGWLGYLQDHPDYWTQGDTLEDLSEHLIDLRCELTSCRPSSDRKLDGPP
jgi:hypothetical protein